MGSMRKEVTIGFSVITVLLLVLGVLIYRRASAMWQTPQADDLVAASPIKPIVPVDGRQRIVATQETSPADTETDSAEPYSPPVARQERPHSSFLPRQFDQAENDQAGSPAAQGNETIDERTPSDVDGNAGAMPADASSSLSEPAGGRQTSHEVADGEFVDAGAGRQPLDEEAGGADLSNDPTDMTRDSGRDASGQDWPASADRDTTEGLTAAEGLTTGGSLPAESSGDTGYGQQGIPDQATDLPPRGRSEFDRREGFAGGRERDRNLGHVHHEPERVAIENGKYTVAPNDNYWIIAEKVYGNGAYFKALFEHNRMRYPRSDKLQVGDVLDAPSHTALADRYPDLCPKQRKAPSARQTLQPASTRHHAGDRVYVVGEGDTLFDIARHELGKAARWTEIYDLNHDVLGEEFDYLRPGTELALPRDHRDADSVTRKDEPVYQR